MSNQITFINNITKVDQIKIGLNVDNKDETVAAIIHAIEYKKIISDAFLSVNAFNNTDDTNTFIKCFNIVNNLPKTRSLYTAYKLFKDVNDDQEFQIYCTLRNSLEVAIPYTKYIICDITKDAIIFDAWRIKCALY